MLQSISCPPESGAVKRLHGVNCAESFGSLKAQWFTRDSFQFEKRSQFFIRVHYETLPIVAMRVNNPIFLAPR
jgi:hypothetical protein